MKSKKQLLSFLAYCANHPDERFWQALRNWSGYSFILGATAINVDGTFDKEETHDTFYDEETPNEKFMKEEPPRDPAN